MESGKIIVVANQKGGVAKTSTVRNLSYALAEMGKKVLVVDFDPQYNLTTSFGVLPTQAPYNTGTLITNLLLDESLPDTNEFIQKIGSVDLIPSSRSLTVAEANLLMTPDSNDYLAALLNPLRLSYDYIIVDTNPSLGSLTINALTAADEVIIPIDPELFALTGLQALVDTIQKIKRKLNPSIEIGGILFTKCNKRTNLYRRTYGQVTKAFQSLPIFNCQIPYTVKVGDANSYGMSVMELEQANPASLAYLELAKEVLANTHDLQNASDNVKRTQYLNLLSWCWEEMSRDRNERCLLVCDEAYLMIDPQVPQSLVFLRNVEKRARKYEAGLAIISHSVVDFLAPEVKMYGQALLDIPCYKILMGCDGKNLQETKDLYNLTDAEQELLESKRRGHALFIIGSKRLHVNFEIPAYKFSYMGKAGGR